LVFILFKNIHTSDVIDIRGDVIAFSRKLQHYSVSHIVNICCISEKMLDQIENGGSNSFYSFAIKVQVARKIGAYLKLRDEDYLVVEEGVLFNDNTLEQIKSSAPDVNLNLITQKIDSKAPRAIARNINPDNSNNIINEIDKIIGIYEKSSGSNEKIPFNEILISSVEPKVSTEIPGNKKTNPIGTLLLVSAFGGALLLGGVFYSADVYDYSTRVLTEMGVLKKESVVLISDEDSNSTPTQAVIEPVEKVVQPVTQSVVPSSAPAPTPIIIQPINKTDIGR
jgi:transcriptional regulator with XRE-family HTH domain